MAKVKISGLPAGAELSGAEEVPAVQSGETVRVPMTDIYVPPAVVTPYLGASAPTGWLLCDGTAVSRTTYNNLFALIGTTYGTGDGSTTFNLPDFRGMFLRGAGSHGSLTMANGGAFAGPSLGASENDQFQGHKMTLTMSTNADTGSGNTIAAAGRRTDTNFTVDNGTPVTDGTNGTPRSGDETRPVSFGVNWIIKT